jgi:hypothetical protein
MDYEAYCLRWDIDRTKESAILGYRIFMVVIGLLAQGDMRDVHVEQCAPWGLSGVCLCGISSGLERDLERARN